MSANVIPFPARRRELQAISPEAGPVPLVVQAHPGAVALTLPDSEFWFDAAQARELAEDLLKAAEAAEREGDF